MLFGVSGLSIMIIIIIEWPFNIINILVSPYRIRVSPMACKHGRVQVSDYLMTRCED